MLDEAMQDKALLSEDREGKNINRAEKWLKANHPEVISKGASEDSINTTRSFINKIRQAVHNARVNDCNWLLGVTRFWFDFMQEGKDTQQHSIMKLDKILGYLDKADDATKQSYDHDFNGLSFSELCKQLESKADAKLATGKDSASKKSYTRNTSYKIINASSFDVMRKFIKWTDWCVAKDYAILDTYVHDGIGQMYVCMKDGFENVSREVGDGFPLDEYGLSLIAVSVDEIGNLNTCTSRWNHFHGMTDHVMTEKQLSELLGMKFCDAFPASNVASVLAGYQQFKLPDDMIAKKLGAVRVRQLRNGVITYVKSVDGKVWECRKAGDDVILHDQKLYTVHDDGDLTFGAPEHVGSLDITGCSLKQILGGPQEVDQLFDCQRNDFTDLTGAPKAAGMFDCSNCYQLTSLKGAPESCKVFKCTDCRRLTSLTGMPQHLAEDGIIDCSQSPVTSLRGCPAEVAYLKASECKLRNLQDAPKKVHNMDVSYNEIVSLDGCPQEVEGDFDCSGNYLRSLHGGPLKVHGDFDCTENRLMSLDGAPAYVGGEVKVKADCFDKRCRISDSQVDAYLEFLKHPTPDHIDDTGHYVESKVM